MFGTLKPHGCSLSSPDRDAHRKLYCGTCKALGDGFGLAQRALLSYDLVFVGAVADALMEEAGGPSSCRCPTMPVTMRACTEPSSPAMVYASAVQILVADQWLADKAADGGMMGAARPLLSNSVGRAHALLASLDVSLADLDGFELRQAEVEEADVGPVEAAGPTAEALGRVFETIAELPGIAEDLRGGTLRRDLRALGEAVGRTVYLADALHDLRKDFVSGAFNPCLVSDDGLTTVSTERVERARATLKREREHITALVAEIPWRRHAEIIDNVLCQSVVVDADRAGRQACSMAKPSGLAELVTYRDKGALRRGLAAAHVFAIMLWVWLSTRPAMVFAQARGDRVDKNGQIIEAVDAGMADGGDVGVPVPHGGHGHAADHGAQACGGCNDAVHSLTEGITNCLSLPGRICDSCAEPCRGIADCCTGCGDSCQSCSDSCNHCTDPCQGCGNGCDGCGHCCDSCNSCNGCCDNCSN